MSDAFQIIVDVEVRPDEAVVLGEQVRRWLAAEGIVDPEPSDDVVGGDVPGYAPGPRFRAALAGPFARDEEPWGGDLRVMVGRRVFHAGGNGLELTCAACGATFEPGDEWMHAAEAWAEGDDAAAYACPTCGSRQRLADWRGPRPWGFGHLGLEFENWPPLSEEFVRSVERRLGHETILVLCHI